MLTKHGGTSVEEAVCCMSFCLGGGLVFELLVFVVLRFCTSIGRFT